MLKVTVEVTGDTLSDVEAGFYEILKALRIGCNQGFNEGEDNRSYRFDVEGEEVDDGERESCEECGESFNARESDSETLCTRCSLDEEARP